MIEQLIGAAAEFCRWTIYMKIGTEVRLKSFNGKKNPPRDLIENENYWKLIGWKGKVVERGKGEKNPLTSTERVCVQFEGNVLELGLECHNEIKNSLLILKSDLEEVQPIKIELTCLPISAYSNP